MAIEIVDLPIKNGGSVHRFWLMFTRPGSYQLRSHMATMYVYGTRPSFVPLGLLYWSGCYMDYIWIIYGLYMDYIWIIYGLYGLYMDYIWIIYGLYMDYIWIIYGLYMDYIWIIYIYLRNYIWNMLWLVVEPLWKMMEFSRHLGWFFHSQLFMESHKDAMFQSPPSSASSRQATGASRGIIFLSSDPSDVQNNYLKMCLKIDQNILK